MSKGVIKANLGNGKYTVAIKYDLKEVKARVQQIDDQITKLNDRINNELQNKINEAQQRLDEFALPPDIMPDDPNLPVLLKNLEIAKTVRDTAQRNLEAAKVQREKLRDEKGKLQRYDEEKIKDLWCVDYTLDLEADMEVGIIDMFRFREGSTSVTEAIIPGFLTGKESKYKQLRDGRRFPQGALRPYTWWYNMMVCAGLERYDPLYRKGEVKAKTNDGKLDVDIDETYTNVLRSEAHQLSSNELHLKDVKVKYLSCDSVAFEVGDRVIVEYPRKNIHTDIIQIFERKKASFNAKLNTVQGKIEEIAARIEAINAEIAQKQAVLDEKRSILNDPGKIDRIQTLQNEIAELNKEVSESSTLIDNYTGLRDQYKSSYEQSTAQAQTYSTQVDDLTATLSDLNAQLNNLIATGASQSMIDSVRASITSTSYSLNEAIIKLQAAQQKASDAFGMWTAFEFKLSNEIATRMDKAGQRGTKQDELLPLLNERTITGQLILILIDDLALSEDKKTKAQNDRLGLETVVNDVSLQITKIDTAMSAQRSNEQKLKEYINTRPDTPTVIGFAEKPKPCEGIAFQDHKDDWYVVTKDEKTVRLYNPPLLIGKFNWGTPNADDRYDAACVWTQRGRIRHGGVNYDLNKDTDAVGVIRDMPSKGAYTIKAVHINTNDHVRSVTTLVVKNGEIITQDNKPIVGGTDNPLPPIIPRPPDNPKDTFNPEVSVDVLVDRSGRWAVVASLKLIEPPYELGLEARPAFSNDSAIWTLDLLTMEWIRINKHHYTNLSDSESSIRVLGDYLVAGTANGGEPGKIRDDSIRYVHNSLAYDADGDIACVAMTDALCTRFGGVFGGGENNAAVAEYAFTYKRIKFIDRQKQIGDEVYKDVRAYYDFAPRKHDTHRLLCSVITGYTTKDVLIRNHNSTPGDYTAVDVVGSEDLDIFGSTEALFDLAGQGSYTAGFPIPYGTSGDTVLTWSRRDFQRYFPTIPLPPVGIDERYAENYLVLVTHKRDPDDVSLANLTDGFSAGCIKVPSKYVDDKWIEIRGRNYYFVDQPSKNYTILI